jgi:UDP-N-acetylglucosamine acyltransferase
MNIHPTAIVESGATLGADVTIGPYCIIGPNVTLGDGVKVISHAVIVGRTIIGPRTSVYPFASVGHQPQDLKYAGEDSTLRIGADCTIREHVTINPGTRGGGMETVVGDRCLLMIGVHVGHDSRLGNNVIMSNNSGVAGHCELGDYVILSGHTGCIQHVKIGAHAFVGAMSKVEKDIVPYGMALGNPAVLSGINIVGLKRRGFDREAIHRLRAAYRMIFASEGTLQERVEDAAAMFPNETLVQDVVRFIGSVKGGLTLPDNVAIED